MSPVVEKLKVERNLVNQFIAPVAAVLVVVLIYTIHVPAMKAAGDIIDAYRENNPADRLVIFERALSRDSFAHQEITEQLAQQAMAVMQKALRKQLLLKNQSYD